MSRLKYLVARLNTKSRWGVLACYLIGAAFAYQVIVDPTNGLNLPDWFPPLAVVLFIPGLPAVIAVSLLLASRAGDTSGAVQTAKEESVWVAAPDNRSTGEVRARAGVELLARE